MIAVTTLITSISSVAMTTPRSLITAFVMALTTFVVSADVLPTADELFGSATRIKPNETFYPPFGERQIIRGRVLLEFSVNEKGRPGRIRVLRSENALLESPAENYLRNFQFHPSADWSARNGTAVRYTVTIGYALAVHGNCAKLQPIEPSTLQFTICIDY